MSTSVHVPIPSSALDHTIVPDRWKDMTPAPIAHERTTDSVEPAKDVESVQVQPLGAYPPAYGDRMPALSLTTPTDDKAHALVLS